MELLEKRTVRDLAGTNPGAARVFEKFGIDYCCGGERSLAEACAAAKANLGEVAGALETPHSDKGERDWAKASMTELSRHIVEKHHRYVREEIPRLTLLAAKVEGVHGKNHTELEEVRTTFQALAEELTAHLMKEERILFPYIEQLEAEGNRGAAPMFGTVKNPVRMMMMEHESAGESLRKLRKVTKEYALPADACMSYAMLYRALQEFEEDLHQHIHLENNILFPRAVEVEGA